jgi:hypothetical protein
MNYYEESPDFYHLDEDQRLQALDTNAESVDENYVYSRPLTEGEIKRKNDEINQALQEIERLKEDRKGLNQLIKTQTEIVMDNNRNVISKHIQVTEKVWNVANTVTGIIEVINKDGYIVDSIRMNSPRMINMFRANQQKEAM